MAHLSISKTSQNKGEICLAFGLNPCELCVIVIYHMYRYVHGCKYILVCGNSSSKKKVRYSLQLNFHSI